MPNDLSTQDLIHQIESRDRRFRTAWVVFMFLTLIVLAAVVAVQLRTLDGVEEQLRQQAVLLQEQKNSTDELKRDNQRQLTKLSNQMDCIAEFFSRSNRTEIRITDLEKCRIVQPDGSLEEPRGQDRAPAGSSTTPQSSGGSTNPGQNNGNGGNGNGGGNPEPPEDPPVEVLGMPVCVPLTNVCVRDPQ